MTLLAMLGLVLYAVFEKRINVKGYLAHSLSWHGSSFYRAPLFLLKTHIVWGNSFSFGATLYSRHCFNVGLSGFFKIESICSCDFTFSRQSGKQIKERENLNYKQPAIVEQLAFLSVKYRVYLAELYHALVLARAAGKSVCEELSIAYRGSEKEKAVFLITKDNKVVVQFKVEENFLSRKEICFDSWMNTDKIRRQISRQNTISSHYTFVQNLRHGMKKVNLEAEVLEAQKPQLVHTQYGNSVLLANVIIADETGKVKLCLWGEQAKSAVVGDIVQIKNAAVRSFKGERQVSLGRTGTISVRQNKVEIREAILAVS